MSEIHIGNEYLLDFPNSITKATSTKAILKSRNFVSTALSLICIAFILVWYVQYLWRRRYLYYHSWNIPGPFAFPFIGIAYLFSSTTSDIMESLIDVQRKYPGLTKLWFGPKLYLAITKPEHIEKVLTNPKALDKDYLYKFISFVIGEGLITARGQKWKKHRKIIMPAFNQKILDKYQEIFARQGEVFADILVKQVGNKELDLLPLVSNCTLDIICETAMGLDMDIQHSNSEFCRNLDRMMEICAYRIFHTWHHITSTWKLYPIGREMERRTKIFKDFTGKIVKKKMEVYHNSKPRKNSLIIDTEKEAAKAIAFLDLILENSNFTEEELREEVDIFMIAGTDTTASALTCIFVILGMYQHVQQKVLEEVLDIMGPDRTPLPTDLPEMKYTERVIKESLRLFPVAAFFLRKIAEDIDCGDVILPAGCSAYFGNVHIHRNPEYWPDPLKFDPDRFLPENIAKRHPCTYIPFSYGPRGCIGGRYAMMNMKTILAIVIRKVKVFTKYKTIGEIKLKTNVVLRLKDGPKVWVESRKETVA